MATQTIEPELEAEIEGFGEVYRVDNEPFDVVRKSLSSKGIKLITPRDLAYARQKAKRNHSLNTNGSYTSAGFAYAKEEPVLLALNSPLSGSMKLAKQAVEANSQGRYFSTSLEVYEKLAQQAEQEEGREPEKRKVLILPSRDSFDITKKENWEVMQGVFKDQADSYFDFNRRNKIETYLIDTNTVDSQDGTILTQLWLCNLGSHSDLGGVGRNLGYNGRLRGMLKKTGEASSRLRKSASVQVKLPYTVKQVDKNSDIVIGVREGKLPASKLEDVVEFLKSLKQ